MNDNLKIELGLKTAFLDKKFPSEENWKAKLLYNDFKNKIKVSTEIIKELKNCDEYLISVAFIKNSNLLESLKLTLKEIDEKGVKGKLLTTDYENVTDPETLMSLHTLKNLEIKMYRTNYSRKGFHTKGYIFKKANNYSIIVGSSNMTKSAMTENAEWNTKIISAKNGEYAESILNEFNRYWNDEFTLRYEDFIDQYSKEISDIKKLKKEAKRLLKQNGSLTSNSIYDEELTDEIISIIQDEDKNVDTSKVSIIDRIKSVLSEFNKPLKMEINIGKILRTFDDLKTYKTGENIENKQKEIALNDKIPSLNKFKLRPNKMQNEFVANLLDLIKKGENKALLISATGTGKTYASAFAIRELNPKKVLFVVHSEKIDRQAMDAYKNVFDDSISMGILSGQHKDYNSNFLFATMQTLSKDEYLNHFKKDEFDVIVIDEAHHATANSYQKIIKYFKPNILLFGMTATPDRGDGDVYEVFDHNIAYEIRLQKALEENMLCPFHYFGIKDMEINGKLVDDNSEIDFNCIEYKKRVEYVLKQSRYYGYSGYRLKGLIFVSRVNEGKKIAEIINESEYSLNRKYRCKFISSQDSNENDVDDAVERLISDDRDDFIDFIVTVNKFNEGVDIKDVNQIIMLRPTESVIVFTQQLGRGLRLSNNKEHTVVLDFIANYNNNYLIPMALYGDRTYNKDNVRKCVFDEGNLIPGETTIQFDEVSKENIYKAIDKKNFSDLAIIKESYRNLRYKLGRIPTLVEFEEYGELDPLRIFDNNNLKSYHVFLQKYEENYKVEFNEIQEEMIEYVSKKIANGKRPHEAVLLELILNGEKDNLYCKFKNKLYIDYRIKLSDYAKNNVYNIMTSSFATGSSKDTYNNSVFIDEHEGEWRISQQFISSCVNDKFVKEVKDLVELSFIKYQKNYINKYKNTNLTLYQKYTYEDVCRLLDWEKSEVALNIGGYKYNELTKTFPIFINYQKDDNISETIKYEDRFIDNSHIVAISKNSRTNESDDVVKFINSEKLGIDLLLFIRKNKDDANSKEFYFLGNVKCCNDTKEVIKDNQKVVEIPYVLDTPVRNDIYEYITKG